MVRVTGSKKLEMHVLHEIFSKDDAEKRIVPYKKKAFGMLHSIVNTFNKNSYEILVGAHAKRFEPFWYIEGESLLQYQRKTRYSVNVKPEVRAVLINGQSFEVRTDSPLLDFEAEDHCFESFTKSIIKNAIGGSDKKLETYRKAPAHKISSLKDLQSQPDTIVLEPTVKISALLRDLIRDLIKPIDADKVTEERVNIKTISLYFRPVHVFELTHGSKTATLEVNAITGEVSTSSPLKSQIASRLRSEQTWFDIGTEIASAVVPGAGVGVILSKHVKDRFDQKKQMAAMKSSQAAKQKIDS